jgi:hypothetical protein
MANHSQRSSRTPSPSADCIWDVQDILAERTTLQGESEVLVVWKASWIPKSNVMADGPVMRFFDAAPKILFRNSLIRSLRIALPVEPGTVLQDDSAEVESREAARPHIAVGTAREIGKRQKRRHASVTHRRVQPALDNTDKTLQPSGPRKQLNQAK